MRRPDNSTLTIAYTLLVTVAVTTSAVCVALFSHVFLPQRMYLVPPALHLPVNHLIFVVVHVNVEKTTAVETHVDGWSQSVTATNTYLGIFIAGSIVAIDTC